MDTSEYDIIHLGVSGGKDSTAVLLWLIYESDIPRDKIKVTFCDTGNEDKLTYDYLAMLSDNVFTIETIKPERDFWELAKWKKRFPSSRARFCTSFLKIIPSREHILELQRNDKNVLLLNGVRASEGHISNNRAEVPKFGWDEGFACDIYRPILDWSIEDVWAIHKKHLNLDRVLYLIDKDKTMNNQNKIYLIESMNSHGIPRNPLYDMGAVRVGCFPCINSRKAEIRAMDKYRPERIDFIENQEGTFGENGTIFSSLFHRGKVTKSHRSKEITTKSGDTMRVCTIRDVVRWSKTAYGGKQFEMEIPEENTLICDIGGMCE